MLEQLRAWLNGSRDYFTGVALYAEVGNNAALLDIFKKGINEYRTKRLQEELTVICNLLKEKHALHSTTTITTRGKKITATAGNNSSGSSAKEDEPAKENILPVNAELYNACKLEADNKYKEIMNKRAELFALAKIDSHVDPNKPDRVYDRKQLALDIVKGFQKTSELYDVADYVKIHGRLANDGDSSEETEYDNIPDHRVKQELDNARKRYNKLKDKETTADRVVLLQKHQKDIDKLLQRWHSLAQ